ncbi:MAG: hypothetical protein ACRENP_07395 [Longimicrobiales bacterium]
MRYQGRETEGDPHDYYEQWLGLTINRSGKQCFVPISELIRTLNQQLQGVGELLQLCFHALGIP